MGDAMPRSSDVEQCPHPWNEVRKRRAKVHVAGRLINKYEVMYCHSCETVLEEV